jgi:hypothetical protein
MLQPQMNTDEHRLKEITKKIIGCVYIVANTLGNGYMERVYKTPWPMS